MTAVQVTITLLQCSTYRSDWLGKVGVIPYSEKRESYCRTADKKSLALCGDGTIWYGGKVIVIATQTSGEGIFKYELCVYILIFMELTVDVKKYIAVSLSFVKWFIALLLLFDIALFLCVLFFKNFYYLWLWAATVKILLWSINIVLFVWYFQLNGKGV